jgi:hypothetical protein
VVAQKEKRPRLWLTGAVEPNPTMNDSTYFGRRVFPTQDRVCLCSLYIGIKRASLIREKSRKDVTNFVIRRLNVRK